MGLASESLLPPPQQPVYDFFHLVSFWELHGDVYVAFYYFLSFLKSVILSLDNSLVQKSRMVFQHSTNRSRGENQGHEHKKPIENPFS